jgi:hypothetical protein
VKQLAGDKYKRNGLSCRNYREPQGLRWVATALLWAEQRLNKVNGYRHLLRLREAIQKEIGITEGKEAGSFLFHALRLDQDL